MQKKEKKGEIFKSFFQSSKSVMKMVFYVHFRKTFCKIWIKYFTCKFCKTFVKNDSNVAEFLYKLDAFNTLQADAITPYTT